MTANLTRRSFAASLAAAAALALPRASRAGTFAQPDGKPILTIAGNISVTNKDGAAVFDRAALEALGLQSFTTTTPWYDGPVTFEGVNMHHLLEFVGASGTRVQARALNDYATEIPIDDFGSFDVLLAMKRDGVYMPVRDKGPLFIVYPFDSSQELKTQKYYSRSVWQIAQLTVK